MTTEKHARGVATALGLDRSKVAAIIIEEGIKACINERIEYVKSVRPRDTSTAFKKGFNAAITVFKNDN